METPRSGLLCTRVLGDGITTEIEWELDVASHCTLMCGLMRALVIRICYGSISILY